MTVQVSRARRRERPAVILTTSPAQLQSQALASASGPTPGIAAPDAGPDHKTWKRGFMATKQAITTIAPNEVLALAERLAARGSSVLADASAQNADMQLAARILQALIKAGAIKQRLARAAPRRSTRPCL